jgi:hypothetical protein
MFSFILLIVGGIEKWWNIQWTFDELR